MFFGLKMWTNVLRTKSAHRRVLIPLEATDAPVVMDTYKSEMEFVKVGKSPLTFGISIQERIKGGVLGVYTTPERQLSALFISSLVLNSAVTVP
jgi:hypothetical protein